MKKIIFLYTLGMLALVNPHVTHSQKIQKNFPCILPSVEILQEQLCTAGFEQFTQTTNIAKKLAPLTDPYSIYFTLFCALEEYKQHISANEMQAHIIDSMLPHLFHLILKNCPATLHALLIESLSSPKK
jgi:hypothetical protein